MKMWKQNYKAYPEVVVRDYVNVTPRGQSDAKKVYLDDVKDVNMRVQLVTSLTVQYECVVRVYAYKGNGDVVLNALEDGFSTGEEARSVGQTIVKREMEQFRKSPAELAAEASDQAIGKDALSMTEDEMIAAGLLKA